MQNDELKKHLHNIITVDISNTVAFTINDHSGDSMVSTDNNAGGYGEIRTNRYFTEVTGGTETRPCNIVLLACI